MCGRYESWIDDDEVTYIIEREERGNALRYLRMKEVFPGTDMPVLYGAYSGLRAKIAHWGYSFPTAQTGKKRTSVINARSETAGEKPLFRDSVKNGRIVVPSSGYFEWHDGVKYHIGSNLLFFAGLMKEDTADQDERARYVVLTTGSTGELSAIHPRMPLMLTRQEVEPWLYDDGFAVGKLAEPLYVTEPFSIV